MEFAIEECLKSGDYLHFLGVGGAGMCPLATACLDYGLKVSGTDLLSNASVETFVQRGGLFSVEQSGQGLINQAKIVVVSSAIGAHNPLYQLALERKVRIAHRSELLNFFVRKKKTLAVTGTHGKSSSAAMAAFILSKAGKQPSYVLGAPLKKEGFGAGKFNPAGDWLVIEADESDKSHELYQPEVGLVSSVDYDHLDCYGSGNAIARSFQKFLDSSKKASVVAIDGPLGEKAGRLSEQPNPYTTYGLDQRAECRLTPVRFDAGQGCTTFTVTGEQIEVGLPFLGAHSYLNVLGVCLACSEAGVPIQQSLEILKQFTGVSRRLEFVIDQENFKWVDDYAHNPGKILAAIEAVRTAFPAWSLVVLFEPHRYSRLETMTEGFMTAFALADLVLVTEVFAAGEVDLEKKWSAIKLAQKISQSSETRALEYQAKLAQEEILASQKPVLLLTLGAGVVREHGFELSRDLADC